MKVVLDANIIIADFNLSSPEFVIILANAKIGTIELYIPQIVLDEVFNKFKYFLEQCQNGVSSEIRKLNKLARTHLECAIAPDFITETIVNYKSHIKETIEKNNIHIIPYPETSHQYLADKAMQIKKPFNANEKGYRDSLIWENVKSMISEKDVDPGVSVELVFITGNCKDFLTDEGDFHEDLISELKNEGLKPESAFAYQSLKDFNRDVFMPSLNKLKRRV